MAVEVCIKRAANVLKCCQWAPAAACVVPRGAGRGLICRTEGACSLHRAVVPRAPCPVPRALIYTPEGEFTNPRQPGACPVPRGAWPVQRTAAGLGIIAPCIERCAACPRPRQRAGVPRAPWPRAPRSPRPAEKGLLLAPFADRHGGTSTPRPAEGRGTLSAGLRYILPFSPKIMQKFPTGARCGHPMANGWADCGGDGAGVHGIRPCCTKSVHC